MPSSALLLLLRRATNRLLDSPTTVSAVIYIHPNNQSNANTMNDERSGDEALGVPHWTHQLLLRAHARDSALGRAGR